MSPKPPPPDPAVQARDQQRHDLLTALTTISGRTQILQRQVNRSAGLTDVERTTMLDGLAVTMTTVRCLIEGLP